MDFRIADTFTISLARLTGDEQKAVKTTAFDLQLDPDRHGLRFHRLDRARDRNFWSVRASDDVRLIVHRTPGSMLLCYVGHHDKAYAWAERRKLETHPTTGAAQFVEVVETVREVLVDRYADAPTSPPPVKPPLFAALPDDDLLGYGVPPEWLAEVRLATEDTLFDLAEHLPGEAAEALLDVAVGRAPKPAPVVAVTTNPFDHPDAQRRFRAVNDVDELTRAMDFPWDRWTVFLHPAQRELVERGHAGPARISGSAGTGKTIVALHRAAFLARAHPEARVLLTTFSDSLAHTLRSKLARLVGTEPRLAERVDVQSLDGVARRLYERRVGRMALATDDVVRELVRESAAGSPDQKFATHFLVAEWTEVVDAWQLSSWEAYRDVARLGRKTRLPEKQRQTLWAIFERVRAALDARGLLTQADVYGRLAAAIASGGEPPYDYVVVDEAQDVSVPQLRFLAALGAGRSDALYFAGDLGQRIFQLPFSWRSLGVDIRGRAGTLRINYRTSHQIRAQADRLLGREVGDVDGNVEQRGDAISVFDGPAPAIEIVRTASDEVAFVGSWLAARVAAGTKPEEIGVLVRSSTELARARAAVDAGGLAVAELDDAAEAPAGRVAIGTMHLSKGLEFRAVVVMACDDEVLPQQARVEAIADAADLAEVYDTERHLLYVACTRARDHLLVTGVAPASEFLQDLRA